MPNNTESSVTQAGWTNQGSDRLPRTAGRHQALLDPRQFLGIKLVVRKFGRQPSQQRPGCDAIFIAQRRDGQQQTRKGSEIVSLVGGET